MNVSAEPQAGFCERGRAEVSLVIRHDDQRLPEAWPRALDGGEAGEKPLLWEDRHAQALHHRRGARAIEADVKAHDHPGVAVDGHRDGRAADDGAGAVVHSEAVDRGVVDLPALVVRTGHRPGLEQAVPVLGNPLAQAAEVPGERVDLADLRIDGVEARRRQLVAFEQGGVALAELGHDVLVHGDNCQAPVSEVCLVDDLLEQGARRGRELVVVVAAVRGLPDQHGRVTAELQPGRKPPDHLARAGRVLVAERFRNQRTIGPSAWACGRDSQPLPGSDIAELPLGILDGHGVLLPVAAVEADPGAATRMPRPPLPPRTGSASAGAALPGSPGTPAGS